MGTIDEYQNIENPSQPSETVPEEKPKRKKKKVRSKKSQTKDNDESQPLEVHSAPVDIPVDAEPVQNSDYTSEIPQSHPEENKEQENSEAIDQYQNNENPP